MSNCSRRGEREQGTGNKKLGKILLFLLPCLLFPLPSWAGPYANLDARLQGQPDSAAVAGLRKIADEDADAQAALDAGPRAARAYVSVRASLEGAPPSKLPPIAAARGDDRIASSWLGRALSRLHPPHFDPPEMRAGPSLGIIGSWATLLMWGILAALACVAIFFLAKYVRVPSRKGRKGLVDEEEPLRSADAWIEEANALIAQGRYREAVRGLYVAGLMRFDEANVARFDRNQTNWEHLRRIEASPRRPEGVEARDATGLFDRCWYGRLPTTPDDATTMRDWYDALVAQLAAEAK